MGYRNFEITIVSADNLPDIRLLTRMRVYAVVSFNGKSFTTNVDMEGKRNPRWNESFDDFIDEELCVKKRGTFVVVRLYCKRSWPRGDKLIGDEVRIEVKSLYDQGLWAENSVPFTVPNTEGGTLNISYRFGDDVLIPRPSAWKTLLGCLSIVSPLRLVLFSRGNRGSCLLD